MDRHGGDDAWLLWPLAWSLATRWRNKLVLAFPGGERSARTWAPTGTMTVVVGDDDATLCDFARGDRVTAALVQAATGGGNLASAAIGADEVDG